MFPFAWGVDPITVQPMGIALALGLACGLWLSFLRARKIQLSSKLIVDLASLSVISSLIGSRLFFDLFRWHEVLADPASFLTSGSGVFGAILLSIPAALLYLRRQRQPPWRVLDVVAPGVLLVVAFGRLGCFASGCCFGKPTHSILGVTFPLNSPAASVYPGLHLLPSQLFDAGWAFVVLLALALWFSRHRAFPGLESCSTLCLYGFGRFISDFYRYNDPEQVLFHIGNYGVQATQLIALLLTISAIGTAWRLRTSSLVKEGNLQVPGESISLADAVGRA